LAIDRKILEFEDNVWFLNTRDGGKQLLISIPPNDVSRKDDWLMKHLVKEDSKYFLQLVEGLLESPAVQKPKPAKVVFDRKIYVDIAKEELGWPHNKIFSRKDDFIKEVVETRQKYEE